MEPVIMLVTWDSLFGLLGITFGWKEYKPDQKHALQKFFHSLPQANHVTSDLAVIPLFLKQWEVAPKRLKTRPVGHSKSFVLKILASKFFEI
jgi:hypothetical protein